MSPSLRRLATKLRLLSTATKSNGIESKCFLLALPTELLLQIASYLSVAEEACLALTCKRLYAIFGAALGSEFLHFARDFAPMFHHYRNGHTFEAIRWQFLGFLENSRWRACGMCLKVHPKRAFSARELRTAPERRKCDVGDLAGIVDLCPCKKMTFRDKIQLVDHLKLRQGVIDVLGDQARSTKPHRYCWHSCFQKYGSTELKIKIYPKLGDDDQLYIRTEYELSLGRTHLTKEEYMTPRFGCAHRSLDLWLFSVCQSAVCSIPEPLCSSCKRITRCGTCNTRLRCIRKRPSQHAKSDRETYTFLTERCLGRSARQPDKSWAMQRTHPVEPYIDLETCTELCPWTVREHPPALRPPSIEMGVIEPAIDNPTFDTLHSYIRML